MQHYRHMPRLLRGALCAGESLDDLLDEGDMVFCRLHSQPAMGLC